MGFFSDVVDFVGDVVHTPIQWAGDIVSGAGNVLGIREIERFGSDFADWANSPAGRNLLTSGALALATIYGPGILASYGSTPSWGAFQALNQASVPSQIGSLALNAGAAATGGVSAAGALKALLLANGIGNLAGSLVPQVQVPNFGMVQLPGIQAGYTYTPMQFGAGAGGIPTNSSPRYSPSKKGLPEDFLKRKARDITPYLAYYLA